MYATRRHIRNNSFDPIRLVLRDVIKVIIRRTTGRTHRGRSTTTGWTTTDGQRTDDNDGMDDGTDGQTEDVGGDDWTRRNGRTEDGRR